MKREEIIEEKIAWQIEEKDSEGHWWMIYETSERDGISEEMVKQHYEKWKTRERFGELRLLKWSKVVKYEVMDGEGF